jgi:membrane-associated phospholipid phosphatase
VTFVAALVGGFLLLTGVSILLGLLVTQVVVPTLGLGGPDGDFVRTLSDNRSGALTTISEVGSAAGGGAVLPIIVGVVGLGSSIARRWRVVAFAIFVLLTESAAYRLTTLLIHRQRPGVERLEDLPANASFPSGHTAASIAVYAGLTLLLTSRLTSTMARALAWTFAVLMVVFVAMSRMYRGMHHPLDVGGGVVLGIGAIVLLLFACRAAGAAAQSRALAKGRP